MQNAPALPEWVQWLQALAVPVIAAVGVVIAWQQGRTAKTKLRHDLYDRRFAVYDSTLQFLNSVLQKGAVDMDALYAFSAGVAHAQFLLDDRLDAYLDDIRKKAITLQSLQASEASFNGTPSKILVMNKIDELCTWFHDQATVLPGMFRPLLTLEEPSWPNRLMRHTPI